MSFATAGDAAAAAASILTGAALVPGARRVLDDAIDEIQHQAAEAVLRSMLEELSPDSRRVAALHEIGVSVFSGMPMIRERPLKPKPHGREVLVKRQKKAR